FPPFYEEYVVLNDSTMRLRTYADSTFRAVTDSTQFELRGGRMVAQPARGNPLIATRVAGDSVLFGSRGEALYLRMSADLWRAIFEPQSPGGGRPYFELRRMR
ncbi:MAG: hypothetical protein HOP28_02105, partial [Gemmatimonadales bacterium]|nr:hypothetical protein [Gemmatimonadales bacterium]